MILRGGALCEVTMYKDRSLMSRISDQMNSIPYPPYDHMFNTLWAPFFPFIDYLEQCHYVVVHISIKPSESIIFLLLFY